MGIIIKDVLTVTMNQKKEIETYTIVIEDGKISSLIKAPPQDESKNKTEHRVIDGYNKIALPGFINGHIHSDMTLARGLGDGLTLYEQDNNSFVSRKKWFYNELNREARYYSKLLQYAEAVKGGTTFLCDVPFWYYGDDLAKPFDKIGINGAVVLDYRENFLLGKPVDKEYYFQTARTLQNRGYLPIVEGPAEENFEEELLLMLRQRADELETFIQLHLAETPWRVDIIKKKYQTTPIKFLHDIGFISPKTIGSHGVYIDESEISILKETGARIVNCPTAEMKISDGIAPVVGFFKNDIPVGIGTDGALWNDSSDMFSEMKSLMLIQRIAQGASSIDAYSCLNSATLGGARVFGLEKELGSIEVGKRACIVLIDFLKPHMVPLYHGIQSNILQNLVSCARASDVDTVIIDGKIVVQEGLLCTFDEQALIKECQKIGKKRFKNLQ